MYTKKSHEIRKAKDWYQALSPWVAVVIVIMMVALIRVRLLEVPLERDEGEYAYAGQLILEGVAPYEQVYNMKMPGIYVAYALIEATFGQTHGGIHLGLLVINAVTIVVLFLLAGELFGPVAGVASSCTFAVLSLGQHVQGVFANAEHFVILPAMCGIWLLVRGINRAKILLLGVGGMLLGLGFLIKQHGGVFIVFGGLYLVFRELGRRTFNWKGTIVRSTVFALGVLLPIGVTCLILWWAGVFGRFWFWTIEYAREYVSSEPLSVGLETFRYWITRIIGSGVYLWILSGIGLLLLWFIETFRRYWVFVAGFVIFSFLAICPGFYFRPHYFILLMPAVSLLAGIGFACIHNFFSRDQSVLVRLVIPLLLVFGVLFDVCYRQRDYFFNWSPERVSRSIYGRNPFPESLEVAKYIREHSSEDDRIAVIGSEPQIYFYSHRRSATGYIYTYPLMENHKYALEMQEEMIREIESARPEYLVFANIPTSWLVGSDSERRILQWFHQYKRNYHKVGMVVMLGQETAVYFWDENVSGYLPKSGLWLSVFRRKSLK
jgi:hypothetical protein